VSGSAQQPLRFATGLSRAQAAAATAFVHLERPLAGRLDEDLDRAYTHLLEVARFAADHGPSQLRHTARIRVGESFEIAQNRLALYWSGEIRARDDYLSRAMLRPYAAMLRHAAIPPDRNHAIGHCPFCGGVPATSCRRSGASSDGAARSLVCALCGLEWPINRILCPACRENEPRKLPAFASEALPLARIEACETCGRYLKSVDLSVDPRAVPEADDVASLALDLWAVEHGYTRLEPGLAGL
jgi:formate dehydrogenase accessory protein FdhE